MLHHLLFQFFPLSGLQTTTRKIALTCLRLLSTSSDINLSPVIHSVVSTANTSFLHGKPFILYHLWSLSCLSASAVTMMWNQYFSGEHVCQYNNQHIGVWWFHQNLPDFVHIYALYEQSLPRREMVGKSFGQNCWCKSITKISKNTEHGLNYSTWWWASCPMLPYNYNLQHLGRKN